MPMVASSVNIRALFLYENGHPLTGTESVAEGRQKVDALVDALAEKTLDFFRQPDDGMSTS